MSTEDIANFDWNKYLRECMESTEYCCIGTVDNYCNVWTNPVSFAYDDKFHIYFISQINSRHSKNIIENTKISISVYSTTPIVTTEIELKTVQLEGKAIMLKDDELEEACKYFYTRPKSDPNFVSKYVPGETIKQHQDNALWKMFKVTPEYMWLFDTRFFEEERVAVPRELYSEE